MKAKFQSLVKKAQELQLKGFPYMNLTVEKQFGYFTPSLKFGFVFLVFFCFKTRNFNN